MKNFKRQRRLGHIRAIKQSHIGSEEIDLR